MVIFIFFSEMTQQSVGIYRTFANHKSNEGLMSWVDRELLKLNNTQLHFKNGQSLEHKISKEVMK